MEKESKGKENSKGQERMENAESCSSRSQSPTPLIEQTVTKKEIRNPSTALREALGATQMTKNGTEEIHEVKPTTTSSITSSSTSSLTVAASSSTMVKNEENQLDTEMGEAECGDGDSTMTVYEIKWNNYSSVLQNVFRKVLATHQFSDVTLACEGESIQCHRILLAACSSYFARILNDNHDSKLVIYMKDVKLWELKALVNFMYNGQVSVQESQLPSFMKAAEALNINGLDGVGAGGLGATNGVAEARTISEDRNSTSPSAPPAKIITTFKRPSLTKTLPHGSSRSGTVVGVPTLQPQPKRKLLMTNINSGPAPPKLVRMQQLRSNGVNNLGIRSTGWRNSAMGQRQNGVGGGGDLLGQVVGYEDEDYMDDDELDQGVLDNEGGTHGGGGVQGTDDVSQDNENSNGANGGGLENGADEDEELEDGIDLQQYENDEDGQYGVYGLEGNQDDEQFEDDDEPPYGETDDGEEGMMVINETATPVQRTRNGRTYAPELQEAAFDAMRNGVSIRQCSELFGIPRKTLGKWKNRGLHLQPSSINNAQILELNSAVPKKRGPAIGSSLSGPEGADRARRLQKATKMAMSGITVRQAAAHYDIPRTTLCAYMKRQGLASMARNVNSAKVQNYFAHQQAQLQQRRVGATTITLSRTNGGGSGGGNNGRSGRTIANVSTTATDEENGVEGEEEDEIPFLGLSDYLDQNSETWEAVQQ